jgi:hypothetical protein
MIPKVSFRKAITDKQLLGNSLAGDDNKAWRTILIVINGEPLIDDEERELFYKLTHRSTAVSCSHVRRSCWPTRSQDDRHGHPRRLSHGPIRLQRCAGT